MDEPDMDLVGRPDDPVDVEELEEREEREGISPVLIGGLALLALALVALVVVFVVSGDETDGDDTADAGAEATQDDLVVDDEGIDQFGRDEYQRALDDVIEELEQSGAGGREAIESGDVAGVTAFVDAWDVALASLDVVVPPDDVREQHEALVDAMGRLATSNQELIAAAQAGEPVDAVYEQIQGSADAADFRAAQCALQAAGYEIVPVEQCPDIALPEEPEGPDDFGPADGATAAPEEITDPPEAFLEP